MKYSMQTANWLKELWLSRQLLLKSFLAGAAIGFIIYISLPNEYETTILCGTELTRYEIAAEESP
ncbi:hypothetical protein LJC29_07860, partial [Bacteroides sp. OttesenSCG-928-N06]|nr:hypothetical protein [Bacteroides sp. OttesenSCG-928-N06]